MNENDEWKIKELKWWRRQHKIVRDVHDMNGLMSDLR